MPDTSNWVIMAYMNGNNELEPETVAAMREMEETVKQTSKTLLFLQIGRLAEKTVHILRPELTNSPSCEPWNGVRRYAISQSGKVLLGELGESNMATVSTPSSTPVGTVCALEDAEEPEAAGAAEPELPQAAREAVMMLYNFGAALLRAKGDTRRPLYFLLLSGAVNVALNLLLVIVFHLDVAGVAIATVISQCISAVLVVICLMRETGGFRLELKALHIHKDQLVGILRVGLPAGVQGVIFSLSNVVIQSSINSFGEVVMFGTSPRLTGPPLALAAWSSAI